MSNTKHTPGPWYEYDMGWSGQTAIAVKHANSNFLIVPAMNKGANARLIAAAPELLAALKDTFDALLREKIAYNQRIGADYETAHKHALLSSDFAAARAAIAKATGNTSADL